MAPAVSLGSAAPIAMVLAADVVYPTSHLEPLLQTIRALRRPTLLGYVERSASTTEVLMSALATRMGHVRCRSMPLRGKARLIALDQWLTGDSRVESASVSPWPHEHIVGGGAPCVVDTNITSLQW
uniref:Uncharacterized protein n=1 Tax=Haptolina brevifila TaxID=156173 RepID=A0A7S2BN47_9EUKA|mmetsp:Transcript_14741/g.29587  ORF Transcript_14741/g.29587 Transcript_14741/m.29587 type:complete len:126 (+) Transcript_14741:476-853(+)